jgi:hypothetical protein
VGGNLPTTCTDQTQVGLVAVDDFNCDVLGRIMYTAPPPQSCNLDPEHWEGDVYGCRFGAVDSGREAGTIDLLKDASDDFWDLHVLSDLGYDYDDPASILATCYAPDTCRAGDEDSGVFWESTTCILGIGVTFLGDALYKCSTFDRGSTTIEVCP